MPDSLNSPADMVGLDLKFESELKELEDLLIEGRSGLLAKDIAGFEAVLRKQALISDAVVQAWREIQVQGQTNGGRLPRGTAALQQQVRRVVAEAKLQQAVSRRLWEQSHLLYRAAMVSTADYAAIAVSSSDVLQKHPLPQARNLWEASTQV